MKTIPQNFGNVEQKETKVGMVSVFRPSFIRVNSRDSRALSAVGRLCQTPWRFTETPYNRTRFCFILTCLSLFCATSFAQTPDNVAEREVQRRQAGLPQGEAALARGKTAMKAKNYTLANEEFKTAVGYLPDSVVSGKAHDEAVDGYCKSAVILAQARIAQGDYAGAEAILSEALSSRYDPNCREAQELYNTAARKGQEKINNTKYQYGEEAYDETRSRQLWKVEGAWQEPVRKYGAVGPSTAIGAARDLGGTAQVSKKLNSIIIPHIEFRDATIREAIDVLREQAAENDTGPEGQRGVNIVLRLVPLGQIAPPSVQPVATPTGTGTPVPGGAPPVGPAAGAPPAGQGTAPGQT